MRVLVIADRSPDLPSDLPRFIDAERVEAIITAGDLIAADLKRLAALPLPKLGVYGNHCNGRYLEDLGFTNLHLRTATLGSLRLTGLQGCVRYKTGESDILYTQEEYHHLVRQLLPADVLITHCPPRGINDHTDPAHVGIDALREWVDRHPPAVLVHGHTYPKPPLTQHGPTRVEYVAGASILDISGRARQHPTRPDTTRQRRDTMNQLGALRETVQIAEQCGMPEMPGTNLGLDHLRSMLAILNSSEFSDAKLGRWLGWAQCAVVAARVGVTLEDMKALNIRFTERP